MNRTYQINKASFAIPRKKFRTIIDRDVWLWTRAFRKKEESKAQLTIMKDYANILIERLHYHNVEIDEEEDEQ